VSDDLKGEYGEPWVASDIHSHDVFDGAAGAVRRLEYRHISAGTDRTLVATVRSDDAVRIVALANALDGVPTDTLTAEAKPYAVLLALAVLQGDTAAANALADLVTEGRQTGELRVGDAVQVCPEESAYDGRRCGVVCHPPDSLANHTDRVWVRFGRYDRLEHFAPDQLVIIGRAPFPIEREAPPG
jgi:hypothetical protein